MLISTLLYALAWFVFAAVHSLLARQNVQTILEAYLGRFYRLAYNLLAAILIAAVMLGGIYWLGNDRFTALDNRAVIIVSSSIRVIGFIILLVALSTYDLGRFTGISQLFTGERVSENSNEPLQTNGINRWVRHPLYTGAFFVLWGDAISPFGLWTAVWGTVYLVIGTRFEERKLVRIYGDDYRRYQREVPCYFPTRFNIG